MAVNRDNCDTGGFTVSFCVCVCVYSVSGTRNGSKADSVLIAHTGDLGAEFLLKKSQI